MPQISVVKKIDAIAAELKVSAEVRYWEDGTVNGAEDTEGKIPLRNGKNWEPVIDLETGRIEEWPEGVTADVHYKVCDAGTYTLIDQDGKEIKSVSGYVPDILCPNENGYGDYIIFKVLEDGTIEDFEFEYDEDYWNQED